MGHAALFARMLGAAGVVVAAVTVGGCGGGGQDAAKQTPHASPSPSATAVALPAKQAVRTVALVHSDLPGGYRPDSMRHGDLVKGQVSLDVCGGDFPSDALRIARHQVSFQHRDGTRRVANEVLVYRAKGAAQAMAELRRAVRNCPSDFVPSLVAGQPETRNQIRTLPSRPRWQPGTLAIRTRTTERGAPPSSSLTVYQPRGDVLSILYASDEGPSDVALADRLADLIGTRLDTLPATTGKP